MEKPIGPVRHFAALLVLLLAGGCRTLGLRDENADLSLDQRNELAAYVYAYHFCVAHAAAQLDDRQSPIVQLSTKALNYCAPEAADVAAFLDSTKLSDSFKEQYVEELHDAAAQRSAQMLRRLRDKEEGRVEI